MRYIRGCDRRDYDLVRAAYHPDAYDDHGPYKGGPEGLIDWVQKYNKEAYQMMHHCSPCHIEIDGNKALVETYCILLQEMKAIVNGTESLRQIVIPLRYVDRFEKRDGSWKIAHRVVVYEQLIDEPLEAQKVEGQRRLGPAYTQALRSQEDPVYKVMNATPPPG